MEENATNDGVGSPMQPPTVPVLYLREQPLRYAAPSVMSLTLLIGVVGNSCLLYTSLRARRNQPRAVSVSDGFLIGLAVVDLILLILVGPFFAVEFVLESWPFGGPACTLLLPVYHLAETVGAYTVGALALDECLVIALPDSYAPRRDRAKSLAANLGVWFVSVVLTIPVSAFTTGQESVYRASFCTVHTPGSPHAIQLYMFLTGFCIPVLMTMACLLWILYQSNGNLWRPTNDESQPRSKRTRATVLLIGALLGAQALLWLPHHLVSFLRPGIYSEATTPADFISHTAVACYAYSYSAVKPLVYVFLKEDVRDRFVEAIPFGRGSDIKGIGRGRRLPTTPVRYNKKEKGAKTRREPSMMTSSMRTIHGYPHIVEGNYEDQIVMNGLDRRWSM